MAEKGEIKKGDLEQEVKVRIGSIGEMSDELLVKKIDSDFNQSQQAWQDLKSKFTDWYFDFLSWKEDITDIYKSNTFIPLPYVAIMWLKSRLKSAILSGRPYFRVIPEPFEPMESYRLSKFCDLQLEEAGFPKFIDLILQDCLIYGNGVFQVVHDKKTKMMPAFLGDELGIKIPFFGHKRRDRVRKYSHTGLSPS